MPFNPVNIIIDGVECRYATQPHHINVAIESVNNKLIETKNSFCGWIVCEIKSWDQDSLITKIIRACLYCFSCIEMADINISNLEKGLKSLEIKRIHMKPFNSLKPLDGTETDVRQALKLDELLLQELNPRSINCLLRLTNKFPNLQTEILKKFPLGPHSVIYSHLLAEFHYPSLHIDASGYLIGNHSIWSLIYYLPDNLFKNSPVTLKLHGYTLEDIMLLCDHPPDESKINPTSLQSSILKRAYQACCQTNILHFLIKLKERNSIWFKYALILFIKDDREELKKQEVIRSFLNSEDKLGALGWIGLALLEAKFPEAPEWVKDQINQDFAYFANFLSFFSQNNFPSICTELGFSGKQIQEFEYHYIRSKLNLKYLKIEPYKISNIVKFIDRHKKKWYLTAYLTHLKDAIISAPKFPGEMIRAINKPKNKCGSFSIIPTEIFDPIISHMNLRTMYRFAMTCRELFHTVCESSGIYNFRAIHKVLKRKLKSSQNNYNNIDRILHDALSILTNLKNNKAISSSVIDGAVPSILLKEFKVASNLDSEFLSIANKFFLAWRDDEVSLEFYHFLFHYPQYFEYIDWLDDKAYRIIALSRIYAIPLEGLIPFCKSATKAFQIDSEKAIEQLRGLYGSLRYSHISFDFEAHLPPELSKIKSSHMEMYSHSIAELP